MSLRIKSDDLFTWKTLIEGKFVLNSLSKSRKTFITNVLELFLCERGKINFFSLAKSGVKNEQYYRRQFEKYFDFIGFNSQLIQKVASEKLLFMLSLTTIPKNGDKTFGIDKIAFGESESEKKGISFIRLTVLDIENEASFHLGVVQLPTRELLNNFKITIQDYALSLVGQAIRECKNISKYLYVEERFLKRNYLSYFQTTGLYIVSSLRENITLHYRYQEEKQERKTGRPTIYAGKVDFKCLDAVHFKIVQEMDDCRISSAILWDKALQLKLQVVVVDYKVLSESTQKRYFSTDEKLDPLTLLEYCKSSIHTEALSQDAVKYTGLNDCQAIGQNKLNFHVNASLTAINVAKTELWLQKDKSLHGAFSMENAKKHYYNKYQLRKREETKHLKEQDKHIEQTDKKGKKGYKDYPPLNYGVKQNHYSFEQKNQI